MGAQDHVLDAQNYLNRELSWLSFNHRVLMEACNLGNPLLERVRFLAIFWHNLDGFLMVRVSSLHEDVRASVLTMDPAGLLPSQQLEQVLQESTQMVREADQIWKTLATLLNERGLLWTRYADAPEAQRQAMRQRLVNLAIVHTPIHAEMTGNRVHLLLVQKKGKGKALRLLALPDALPRVWRLGAEPVCSVLLEDAMADALPHLFPGETFVAWYPIRILRGMRRLRENSEEHLLQDMEISLAARKHGEIEQLLLPANMPEALVRQLTQQLQISEATVCRTQSPIQLDEALQIFVEDTQHAHLRYPPFERKHVFSIDMPIFEQIKQGDIFVHHPYDGFEEVIRFMQTAVQDPKVVSIRQTLYRVSEHSALMIALEEAAHAGKQVVVLLEVKARFDEANNMRWGKRLQRAGCRVLYGIPGLKTHAKITLIIRREVDGLRRYVHLGTGNYHEETACSYTDMGLFTARETFGQDAEIFFRMLCGEQHLPPLQQLICAPTQLRDTLVLHITREIQSARQGKPASIMAKMNALVDPSLIAALYEASQAGVSIRLIVRGICCLRPGVAGISEHITVRSIVGRFLEHSRIFRFENGGNPCLYLSSADWMPRNLDRRIELMFPVLDEKIARKIETVLHLQWMDDCKAWNLQVDGCYARVARGKTPCNAQEWLMQ